MPSVPKSTNDIPLEQTSLFLFIGPADGGKSYAATSFGLKGKKYGGTDEREAYVLELDGRLAALRGRPVVYDNYTNVEGAIGILNRLEEIRENCHKYNKAPCHTLIVDSFTSFNDFAIADSLEVTEGARDGGASKGRVRGELLMMTVEDYGYEAEAVRKLLMEKLTDIKKFCNVILTAHEVEAYRPVAGLKPGEPTRNECIGYKVLARDKIAARIPTKFDEIYHFLPKEPIANGTLRRSVVFQDNVARTSYPQLAAIGTKRLDISNKEFYTLWKELIEGKGEKK